MVSSFDDSQNLLEELRRETSLDLLGVADIRQKRNTFQGFPAGLIEAFPLAIVVAVHVSTAVLNTLEDGPNLLYYHHYRQLNSQLDRAAWRIAQEIERKGYSALPIPASQIIDWQKMAGHLSHKELAHLAGLGWRGRNNLLVTPRWGAQVRLASILTDFPLQPGHPLQRDCGSCQRCLTVCPAKAIKREATAFDHSACYEQLREFSRTRHIGQYVCGLCVKACSGSGSNKNKQE
jgi:epoxyqueuosine reductase QueG